MAADDFKVDKDFKVVEFFYIIAKTISLLLDAASFAMLLRMILPFFLEPEESRIYALTFCISEPFIAPVRMIMAKLDVGQNSPIDWAFFATYFILMILRMFLPII